MELCVAQGSGLSPFLFNTFINDFVKCSTKLIFILYADDSTLSFSSQNLPSFSETVNSELQKVAKWLHTNKLTVNTGISNYIVFEIKKNPIEDSLNIYLDNVFISRKETAKFSGVFVN